jgi:hypothetical protein
LDRGLLKSWLLASLLAILLTSSNIWGVEIKSKDLFPRNFVGVRMGAWTTVGNEILQWESADNSQLPDRLVYGEFFYAHKLNQYLSLEASIGVFSPRDLITYPVGDYSLVGTVTVTPAFLSLQLFPLHHLKGFALDPYLQLGGGIVLGSEGNVDYYYDAVYDYNHAEKLTYCLGGGFNWAVASQIALTTNLKYVPVKFGKALIGFKDFSGWQLSIGAGYTFGN